MRWPLLLLLAALTAGCRNHAAQELLERDLRRQEDRIYELEDKVQQQCDLLEATRRENDALRSQAGHVETIDDGSSRRGGSQWRARDKSSLAPPAVTLPEQASPYGGPPEIRSPNSRTPDGETPRNIQPPLNAPKVELPPGTEGASSNEPQLNTVAEVMAVTLHQQHSHGFDADGKPGDEGIVVVVEPRAVDGGLVARPGPVSIVLMDPAAQGPAARLARWDFATDEVAKHWTQQNERRTEGATGYTFRMRWTGPPPRHNHLALNVRYVTLDGRKLDATLPVQIELPGDNKTDSVTRTADQNGRWLRSTRQPQRQPTATPPSDNTRPTIIIEPPETPEVDREPRTASKPGLDRPAWTPYR